MYSNEKNPGINWKDLIIKAIFLVAFLLLLVWLFPKVPNMKPFYSNVFRENIKYMQDAAESYYTTERLPKNIGDSAEMTLQEMINKNLILPFVDQDGNECDTYSSYVSVKKNKNDYTLKVNLVCPTESNYVEKTLGCYQYCDTCNEELEYEFKKEVTSNKTIYSCPEGGTLSGTTCNIYKTDSYKATEITSKGEAYCPKGGTVSGDKCIVSDVETYPVSVSIGSYYCPNGGSPSGSTCYVSNVKTYDMETTYECENKKATLSGSVCIVPVADKTVDAQIKYTCPDGTVQDSPDCKTTTASQTVDAKILNYTCPDGTVQSSPTCTKAGSAKTTKTPLSGTYTTKPSGATCSTATQYVCTSSSNCPGYITVYTSCYKNVTTYTCPSGYSGSATCTAQGKPNYTCTVGTPQGNKCIISGTTTTTKGTPKYICTAGTPSGAKCIISGGTTTVPAVKKSSCPAGTKPSGNRCIIDNSYTYWASLSSGNTYCSRGGNIVGNNCVLDKSYSYAASKTTGETVLTCPNGGDLQDKDCYKSVLAKSYKATATTKKITSYKYEWSKEQTLAGWTPTGETRVITSSQA